MEEPIRRKKRKCKRRELKSISPTKKNTAIVEGCRVYGRADSIFTYLGTKLYIELKNTSKLACVNVRDIHKQKDLDRALQEAPHNKIEVQFENLSLHQNEEGFIFGFADTYNIIRLI